MKGRAAEKVKEEGDVCLRNRRSCAQSSMSMGAVPWDDIGEGGGEMSHGPLCVLHGLSGFC